ncbi:hypothetical protein [Lewinella sp. IMCC34183]|uniref:hypothetical protein n=1 Tax=Lewinella sp. IMCC34183 TaxID=2248762 RepID=UPI000E2444CE|nr:hypothetical protein [Lewinella sp. IMCC34183]
MIFYILAALLFALCAVRFFRRARQEARRQRTLTWPRATATLTEDTDTLEVASVDRFDHPTFYRAELTESYVFYARGQRFTGRRLAPGLDRLNASEAGLFLKELAKHRTYEVQFDPRNPEDNYLTVGNELLNYGKQIMYLLYGTGLPALFIYLGGNSGGTPGATFIFVCLLLLGPALLAALYFSVKPLFNLGSLLLPVVQDQPGSPESRPGDDLLDSLARRPTAPAAPPQKIARKERR